MELTQEQKQQAIKNIHRAYDGRTWDYTNRFAAWGNNMCISRAYRTMRDMESDTATQRQWLYWIKH